MGLLWSISLEEQFYLVWPWAMRLLSKRGLIICAALFIVVANITLFILGQRHADTDTSVWTNTFVQFEMFATGILLAIANEESIWNSAAIGSALALMGPVLWFIACFAFHIKQAGVNVAASNGPALMIGYGMVAFGCAAVLQGFSMIGPSWIPWWAMNLGKISYGLYVYHILAMATVGSVLRRLHIGHYYVFGLVLAFPVTILAAKVSYIWLESPFLQLKRRFEIVHGRPV
jgi:peptidoglycan/LPS O-acetylase OafA/YrhL